MCQFGDVQYPPLIYVQRGSECAIYQLTYLHFYWMSAFYICKHYLNRINWTFCVTLNDVWTCSEGSNKLFYFSSCAGNCQWFLNWPFAKFGSPRNGESGFCVLSRSELISLCRHKTWPERRTIHAFLQNAINMLSKIQNWESMSLFSTSFYWQRWQIAWARHTEDDYYISGGAHVHELSVPYHRHGS